MRSVLEWESGPLNTNRSSGREEDLIPELNISGEDECVEIRLSCFKSVIVNNDGRLYRACFDIN